MTKKLSIYTLVFLLLLSPLPVSAAEVYWYLASSLTKPGKELVETFNRNDHKLRVILITGGSGQLLSKISSAKKGDLYTPAAMSYVARAKKLNLLKNNFPLITQTPVFALSANGMKKIHNWSELTKPGIRIGLGNPRTMALGRTFQQIQKKIGPESAARFSKNMVVEGVNLSQIINYLKAGIIDAGIAFESTARANNLRFINIPPDYNHLEQAPLIRLKYEKNTKNTDLFINFIMNNLAIFKNHGFRPVNYKK
jgi:molybdate transport system substrate-binding protein